MNKIFILAITFFTSTALAGEIGPCLQDVAPFKLNCTSSDVKISKILAMEVYDGCVGPDDTATLRLMFKTKVVAAKRFDLGYYFSLDGGDALTGTCQREYLSPVLFYAPTEASLLSGYGPYPDIDGDMCGDGWQRWPMNHVITDDEHPKSYVPVVVPCADRDNDGKLDIAYCTTWKNASHKGSCDGVEYAGTPQSPNKCKCATLNVFPPIKILKMVPR